MNKSIIFLTAVMALLAAVMLHVRPARAADAVVGNGAPASCNEAAFDSALATANSGGGTITFNCGAATKTISFTSQKSILTEDVTIDGGNRIILSGGGVTRHFVVNGGLIFRLQRITLRDGDSPVGGGAIESAGAQVVLESANLLANNAKDQGGAIYCYVGTGGALTVNNSRFEQNTSLKGGAIYNDGCAATISNSIFQANKGGAASSFGGAIFNAPNATLSVNNSRFKGNSALDGGALYIDSGATATLIAVTLEANSGGYGGGLENRGVVTLTDSLLNLNSVTGSGGGVWNLDGTVTLQRTTVSNNSAHEGGGINNEGNHLQISDANIVDNVATGTHGGGLFHGGGTAFISNATISGNKANASAANGGGIYQNSDGNLTLTNATVMNNQAGLFGGGFYHFGRYAILTNVTIGNNKAGAAGDAIYEDSPMTPANPGVIQMANSVIYGSANNCDGPAFQSFGHNISKGTCSSLSAGSDQDNFAGDLKVGGLMYNGGAFPMKTVAPLAGSPLIDAGDGAQCKATDQRGAPRTGVCDIGAVEFGAVLPLLYLPIVVR